MRAGTLKQLVALQTLQATQGADGQPSQTWVTVAAPWCNIRHLNGAEALRSGAPVSTVACSVRMRKRVATPGQRILTASGAIYDVRAVLPENTGEYIDLVCVAGVNDG